MKSLHKVLDQPVTPKVEAILRLSLLDWLACGIAGAAEPVSQAVRQVALSEAGAPQSTLFGGGSVPSRTAALVNGTISHALDYDDTHFAHIGHPSVAIFPAAIALAEARGRDLKDTLRAAIRGTEASVRFGLWFGRAHYQTGFHQTATAGAFGATVAACDLIAPGDQDLMDHALALVSTRASGLKAQFGTMGKPYNAGLAASNGVEAAVLAEAGMTSTPGALQAFYETHHCDGGFDDTAGWRMETVSHKLHACCHGLHAALEALGKIDAGPANITRIAVQTHPRWLTVCNQPSPDTGLGLKFSYRGALALALLGEDTAKLDTFSDTNATRPDVVALREKVEVVADDTLTEMQARVMVDGAVAEHDLDTVLPLEALQARLLAKADALIGPRASDLWNAIQSNSLQGVLSKMS